MSGAHLKVLQHVADEKKQMASVAGGSIVGAGQDPSLMECAISLKLSIEANAETVAAMEVGGCHELCRKVFLLNQFAIVTKNIYIFKIIHGENFFFWKLVAIFF